MTMIYGILLLILANIVAWAKGQSKYLWGLEMSVWGYWMTFGLVTNFLGLSGWWRICDSMNGNFWVCSLVSMVISVTISVLLNSVYYGINYRMACAMCLVALAGIIAK